MSLAVILRGYNKLPVLTNAASRLLVSQSISSGLVCSPVIARNYYALSRPVLTDKNVVSSQLVQSRGMHHGTIWAAEKFLSAALLAIIPLGVAYPSAVMDNVMAVSIAGHMHWGVEAIVVDYVRPQMFGNAFPKIARLLVYLVSAFTLGGLMYFNMNDIGIGAATRRFWAIKHA